MGRLQWTQMVRIIESAPHLTRFSIRHFACGAYWPHPRPPLCFKSLVELDICFCADNTSYLLWSSDMPSLRSLSFTLAMDMDLDHIFSFERSLTLLTTLTIAGSCNQITTIACMYSMMPCLTRLDISKASSTFAQALHPSAVGWPHPAPVETSLLESFWVASFHPPATGERRVVCPYLSEIVVGVRTLGLMRALLGLRGLRTRSLDALVIHDAEALRSIPPADEVWLRTNVGRVTVVPVSRGYHEWVWRRA
ncbi:hypothetical protein C8R46DRAFT_1228142 [Mycena filopes]|nr:hypothetical protein C8R46DRAFT_1228142 [Mycena filopes]